MAYRLKKPNEAKQVKADFHVHIYTNYWPEGNRFYLDPGFRDTSSLIKIIQRAGLNLVAITSFLDTPLDTNFEFWTSRRQIQDLPANWGVYYDDFLTFIQPGDGGGVYLMKSEEIPADKGHVLVFGTRRNKNLESRKLDEVVDETEEKKVMGIPDHVGSKWHGISEEDLEPYKKRIHALEWNPQVEKSSRELAEELSEKWGKALVKNSDAHRPNQIGIVCNIFKGNSLCYNNGETLRDSLKENTTARNFQTEGEALSKLALFSSFLQHAYLQIPEVCGIGFPSEEEIRKYTEPLK